MLREVIVTPDVANQKNYLSKAYAWYVQQQRAQGLISNEDEAKESDFLNPDQVAARQGALALVREEKRLEYMDDERHERYMKEIFANEQRTDHRGIIPAKDRIRQYKTRLLKRQAPSTAFPGAQRRELHAIQSH